VAGVGTDEVRWCRWAGSNSWYLGIILDDPVDPSWPAHTWVLARMPGPEQCYRTLIPDRYIHPCEPSEEEIARWLEHELLR
jgi:hypothetical protein